MCLESLNSNLNNQVELHEQLLNTLQNELNLTAHCSLIELQEIQDLRDKTAKKISVLEQERLALIQQIGVQYQLPGEITLSAISEHADPVSGSRLSKFNTTLLDLIQQIQKVAREIAENSMIRKNCITEVQNGLNRSLKRQSVYSKQGMMKQPKGALMMQRAI
mgnify:FL=1